MKKFIGIFTMLLLTVFVLSSACKKHNDDDGAKFLTADGFASSTWTGNDKNSQAVTLQVTSKTNMTITYYESKSLSKNTDGPTKITVKIENYNYNESTGAFSGNGDDNKSYSGKLTSTTKLDLNLPSGETVALTKK